MNRRSLLKFLIHAGTAVIGGVFLVPSLISGLSPALRRRDRRPSPAWRAVARIEEVPEGAVREATVDPSPVAERGSPAVVRPLGVYVWRATAGEVVVFSRLCTDLGCPVNHDAGSGCYFCPCHGGIFGPDGARLAGPPDRPLDRYLSRIRGGVVEIDIRSVPPAS